MNPAVVLMAYGSPDRLSDVPAYYADIRGGRPIRPELLDDLVARYRALGIDDSDGPSPLNAITEETRDALERELGIPVITGMRHWDPRIAAAVEAAIELGHDTVVGLVLAPHWSTLSIAKYEQLFEEAIAGRAETRFVREWGSDPEFVALLARRVRAALDERPAHVVFTAHSLPARASVESGDTYVDKLHETLRPSRRRPQASATAGRSRSRASRRRASRGSARTSSTTSPYARGAGSLVRARLSRRVRLRAPRDPVGPRRRGEPAARTRSACASRASRCRTPIPT